MKRFKLRPLLKGFIPEKKADTLNEKTNCVLKMLAYFFDFGGEMLSYIKFQGQSFLFLLAAQFILLSGGSSAWATTFYVDTNSSTASDSNSGSQTQAWKTISKASATMVAGDTAVIMAGTYNESPSTTRSGTASNRIKFVASGIVNTNDWTIAHDYITVEGFSLNHAGIIIGKYGVQDGSYSEVLNNNVTYGAISMAYKSNPANCLLKGNHLRIPIGDGTGAWPQMEIWGSYNIVESNEIGPSQDIDAFHFWGHDNIIRNNYVHDIEVTSTAVHSDMFQTYGDNGDASYNNTFENNRFINSQGQMFNTSNDGVAGIHDLIIRNNVFAHFTQNGNLGMPNMIFMNNTFYDVGIFNGPNTSGGTSTGAVFKNNIFIQIKGYNLTDYDANLFLSGTNTWTMAYNFFSTITGAPLNNFDNQLGGINGGLINFKNATANDFSLTSTSPVIDRGINLTGFAYDIINTPRPQGASWDMGAFEYISSSSSVLAAPTNLRIN
ncbi:MAG: choice-of-anchor Q domain-containing protein [Pseudobdellovibrionaceae bacterium]